MQSINVAKNIKDGEEVGAMVRYCCPFCGGRLLDYNPDELLITWVAAGPGNQHIKCHKCRRVISIRVAHIK